MAKKNKKLPGVGTQKDLARAQKRMEARAERRSKEEEEQAAKKANRKVIPSRQTQRRQQSYNKRFSSEINSGQRLTAQERKRFRNLKSRDPQKAQEFRQSRLSSRRPVQEQPAPESADAPTQADNSAPVDTQTGSGGTSEIDPSSVLYPEMDFLGEKLQFDADGKLVNSPIASRLFPELYNFTASQVENSPFYQNRINKAREDIMKSTAARGLFNSGAALQLESDSANQIRGEEMERAKDIAMQGANRLERILTNDAERAYQGDQAAADRFKDISFFNADRSDKLGQNQFDNMYKLMDMYMSNSPLSTGYDATGQQAQLTTNYGNNIANSQQQNYARPTTGVRTGGGVSFNAPPPTRDNTIMDIANLSKQQQDIIANANNRANTYGNILNTSGGGGGGLANIFNGISGLFGGGNSSNSATQPKLPGATANDYLSSPYT